jgi:excisionase family DNA binding protein
MSTAANLVDATALGAALGVHASTVRRLARTGRIPYYAVGEALRFDLEQVKSSLHKEVVSSPSNVQVRAPAHRNSPQRSPSREALLVPPLPDDADSPEVREAKWNARLDWSLTSPFAPHRQRR